ncbi:hypothetical protein ACROYT_G001989 [Oculina patagonica]
MSSVPVIDISPLCKRAERTKNVVDIREGFYFGNKPLFSNDEGDDYFPEESDLPGFAKAVKAYQAQLTKLGFGICPFNVNKCDVTDTLPHGAVELQPPIMSSVPVIDISPLCKDPSPSYPEGQAGTSISVAPVLEVQHIS